MLDEAHCAPHPIRQFEQWFQEAKTADLKEPNAMTLATVAPHGKPSARIVLLKGLRRDGFVFYTNYESRKGRELAANPHCALTFYWAELERQVRVEGVVEKVSKANLRELLQRPSERQPHRRGGVKSKRGTALAPATGNPSGRTRTAFANTDDVPMPESWGGYLVTPHLLEFWQGRTNRLHDRIVYRLNTDGTWRMGRLAP